MKLMSEFWRKFFGVEDLVIPEGARSRLEMGGLPSSAWALPEILLLLVLLGVVFWVYRREGDAAPWKKVSLGILRSLVVLGITFVLLEPNLVFDVERTLEATTIVLVDDSQSMSIRDRYDGEAADRLKAAAGSRTDPEGMSRSRLVTEILRNPELDLVGRLASRNRLRVYSFSEGLSPIAVEAPLSPDEGEEIAPPRGQVTNLSRGIRQALEKLGGRTAAGLVILSDGKVNEGELVSVITKTLRARGVPAHVVGIGNPAPPKNIRIDALLANERVFAKDPVAFEIHISSQGLEGERVVGELSQAEEGKDEVALVETVEIDLAGGEQSIALNSRPERAGRFRYSFRIEPVEGEVIQEDNLRTIRITVVDDLIQVLLVAGGPTFEYRFLKNLLLRDPTVRLSTWLQSADVDWLQEGNARIHRLPIKEEEFRAYDVILLFDPDPLELDASWARSLRGFVSDHGGGCLYVAGEKNTLNLMRSTTSTELLPLLPVEPDFVAAERSGGFGQTWPEAWPIHVTPEGLDHAVGMLGKERRESEVIWRTLPGIYWHFPTKGVKPGATVLARHSDPRERARNGLRPIIASQFFGAGRVVFAATDEFWRWRAVAEEVYNRFWMQNIRFLVGGRLLGGKRRVSILLDRESFPLGKPVEVTAKLLDRNFIPLETGEVTGHLRDSAGEDRSFSLQPVAGKAGLYRGVVIPASPGAYELRVGEELGEAASETITVELPNLEFQDPRMDEGFLREVAESTGGRYYDLGELHELPDAIPDRRETVLVSSAPTALWDSPAVLALLAGLLIVEWFFRKRNLMA